MNPANIDDCAERYAKAIVRARAVREEASNARVAASLASQKLEAAEADLSSARVELLAYATLGGAR